MNNTLDLSFYSEYDLIVGRDRDLDVNITCTYVDATGTTQYFDFGSNGYTGATLTIKNTAGTILMTFSTTDGSITLGSNGVFNLKKSNAEMNTVRTGQYFYDMILSSTTYPKRSFLRGNINFIQNITN